MQITDSTGMKLDVVFKHGFENIIYRGKEKRLRNTTCILSTIDNSKTGGDKYTPIAKGTSRQGKRDNDNRKLGNKIAFGRAIKNLPLVISENQQKELINSYNHEITVNWRIIP